MVELPDNMTLRDANQWMREGIVMYKDPKGEVHPCMFLEAIGEHADDEEEGDDYLELVVLEDLASGKRINASPHAVFCYWPRCVAYTYKYAPDVPAIAVQAVRRQTRQYRRTFNPNGFNAFVPNQPYLTRELPAGVVRMGCSLRAAAKHLFAPKFTPGAEALQMIDRGDALSVAVSPNLIVSKSPYGRALYYRGRLAAKMLDGQLIPLQSGQLPYVIHKHFGR
jgi:hypothetical protein